MENSGKIGIWIAMLLLSLGCRKVEPPCVDLQPLCSLYAAPPGFPEIPFPADNAYTPARWELGKKLFYDPVMSRDGSLSCSSCHQQTLAFADDRSFSPGIENRAGTRNAPALFNLAYHPYYLREGSLPTLEMQILVPIQEHNEFDHNIVDLSLQLQQDSVYVRMSQVAYGRDPDPFVITRALGNFQRSLVSGHSPYDRAEFQNCPTALDASEQRGKALFFSPKTNCSQCHGGFNFTNYAFENNGLYRSYTDPGRMRLTGEPSDLARFKVPSLRNVAVTAPYMHDGSLPSLETVIDHYDRGGEAHPSKSALIKPLHLSSEEKSDLLHFLQALTDPRFLTDRRFAE